MGSQYSLYHNLCAKVPFFRGHNFSIFFLGFENLSIKLWDLIWWKCDNFVLEMQRHLAFDNYFVLRKNIRIFIGWCCFIVFSNFGRFIMMRMVSICWLISFIFRFTWNLPRYQSIISLCGHNWSCAWAWSFFIWRHTHWKLLVSRKGRIIINIWLY